MKKTGFLFLVVFLLFYYERYEVIDVTKYQSEKKTVEVKGEVKRPGVYQVQRHACVQEVLKIAGGVKGKGDTNSLNLSMDIENHGVIVVPHKKVRQKISINAASAEELDTLPGIGPSIAQRIVAYRKQSLFVSLEDLKQVKGIGDKLFEKIKDAICL